MKNRGIQKLIELRKLREEKAMKTLAIRQNAVRHAEEEVQAATLAIATHTQTARDQELTALAGLTGQELRASELINLQSSLNAAAYHHDELQDIERKAKKTCEETCIKRDAAQAEFWRHHRKKEKLSSLVRLRSDRRRARQLAISEEATEELRTDRTENINSSNTAPLRNTDA